MAHELVFTNGQAEMFSVRETPWHREGKVLPNNPSYADAITLVGFDYPIEKRPYFYPDVEINNGQEIEVYRASGNAFYTYRPDTKKVLGSVGQNYQVVSNLEAFRVLEPLVDSGVLKLETGGVLRDGADAWLMGQWDLDKFGPDAREVFEGADRVLPYATVLANHSGRRPILVGCCTVRIVCANTLGMAERSGASRWEQVTHHSTAKVKLIEAAQNVFHRVVDKFEVIAKQYRLLKNCLLTHEQFRELVLDVVAPLPSDNPSFNPEAKLAEVVQERAVVKRTEITRLWTDGAGHTGELNAWFALNAVVEAVDHNRILWPTKKGSWRTGALLDGHLAKMKEEVTDTLVEFAQSA